MNDEYKSQNKAYKNISFIIIFLISWILITIIYSVLYFKFLDAGNVSAFWGRIAGFFGLFTPIGLLSLILGLFAPRFILANIIALILVIVAIGWGIKLDLSIKKSILFILGSLFMITLISDLIRGMGLISWYIFIQGSMPPL